MSWDEASARALAHDVLTEFVEAAEPKRQKRAKWRWWWQPPPQMKIYDPQHPDRIGYWPTKPPTPPTVDQALVVSLPMYGRRINAPGGDAE